MKVYVDELPNNCLECPCRSDIWCNIEHYYIGNMDKDCPLQSLAEYAKQVRKEVCDGLALPLIKHFQKDGEFTVEEICKWIEEYKNQIQGDRQ